MRLMRLDTGLSDLRHLSPDTVAEVKLRLESVRIRTGQVDNTRPSPDYRDQQAGVGKTPCYLGVQ